MKKIKSMLPVLILAAGCLTAFAFKPVPSTEAKHLNKGNLVLDNHNLFEKQASSCEPIVCSNDPLRAACSANEIDKQKSGLGVCQMAENTYLYEAIP